MTGYSTEGWGDLFLAAAGATAALSGLIFVGLSVNIRAVLDIDKQVGEAGFILLTAATSAISPARALLASLNQRHLTADAASRLVTAIALTITLVAAGVTLAAGHGGGLDWLPASFVLAIVVAAVNAWILLVEILR